MSHPRRIDPVFSKETRFSLKRKSILWTFIGFSPEGVLRYKSLILADGIMSLYRSKQCLVPYSVHYLYKSQKWIITVLPGMDFFLFLILQP